MGPSCGSTVSHRAPPSTLLIEPRRPPPSRSSAFCVCSCSDSVSVPRVNGFGAPFTGSSLPSVSVSVSVSVVGAGGSEIHSERSTHLMLSRAKLFIEGKVQGVYYRESTRLKATELGLTGAAWNLPDKRVEIVAEGSKEAIEALIAWCWKGPEGAAEVGLTDPLTKKRKVTKVLVEWLAGSQAESPQFKAFTNGGKKKL